MSRKVTTPPVLFTLLIACASTAAMAEVPDNLKPTASEKLAMPLAARGAQIYECRAKKDGSGYEWAFVAPDAELFDANGVKVGKHYAGPHWEANDGSKVAGATKERADAPAPGAIPWLLLTTKSDGPEGTFSKVTSVQRLNTTGGVAPGSACAQSNAGETARVPYTADYYLFTGS
jgi:hypothetical protein